MSEPEEIEWDRDDLEEAVEYMMTNLEHNRFIQRLVSIVGDKSSEDGVLHADQVASDMDVQGHDLINIGSLEVKDTGNFHRARLLMKMYEGEEEPDLSTSEACLWDDGESLWFVYNRNGSNKMVELS